MATISTKGLSKAAVLAALYNASRPLGMGFLQYDPKPMTEEEAAALIGHDPHPHFDYLKGRVMKVWLDDDGFESRSYDRDNGDGAAQRAIDELRAGNGDRSEAHKQGVREAAEIARGAMNESPSVTHRDGIAVMGIDLSDVADALEPKIAAAVGE